MAPPSGERTTAAFDKSATGVGIPEAIGRYRLLAKIAKGGMAEVFAARSYGAHGFEKTVALKRILPKFGRDPQFVRMMVDEAKISVLLNHPHIAQIFELGEHEGDYFIVMEFVPGQSLSTLIKRLKENNGRLPVLEACFIVVELLEGLHAAHTQTDARGAPAHIIHRDVSPQNTLVSFDGHVKVIDFGIARARDRLEATEIGTIKGKLRYLAPEMIDPGRFTTEGDFDHRVDVFAAGIVLWELVAGRPLFPGDDEMKVYDDITDGVTPDLAKEGRCDAALMRIVHKALERRLDRRYATAEAFADELRAYVYRSDPAFTHKRVAAILQSVFPKEKEEALALERGLSAAQTSPRPVLPSVEAKPEPRSPEPVVDARTAATIGEEDDDDSDATAVAPIEAVDPHHELRARSNITVQTLVSREAILAEVRPPSDTSGVFSGIGDATLTVHGAALPKVATATASGSVASSLPLLAPLPTAASSTSPTSSRARHAIAAKSPGHTGTRTAHNTEARGSRSPSEPRARDRLLVASAAVGVVMALLIVMAIDQVPSTSTEPVGARPPIGSGSGNDATPPSSRVQLTVTSSAPAAIVEAAGLRGSSPLLVSVEPGSAVEVIVAAPGMVTVTRRIEIGAAPLEVDIPLAFEPIPVVARIAPHHASITIDGAVVGPGATVSPGPVSVVVAAAGYTPLTLSLLATPGRPLVVEAELTKASSTGSAVKPKGTGTLTITSSPLWGRVTIDGKTYDDTTPLTVSLPAGKHDVVVAHPPRDLVRRAKVTVEADTVTVHSVTFD